MAPPENAEPALSEEELTDLLLEGARYDCAEDVLLALERNLNVNAVDYNDRTGDEPCDETKLICLCPRSVLAAVL